MAFLGISDDFDLDDDGILRDSASSTGGFLLDHDGIVRDDIGIYKISGGHWTDSGFGGDKQSSSSTLLQLQTSFDSDSRLLDQSENISEFEASKDDLSFERTSVTDSFDQEVCHPESHHRLTSPVLDAGNTHDELPLTFQESHDDNHNNEDFDQKELFTEEYYQQLRDLGVLVDGADLSNPKDTLQEFEEFEGGYSHENLPFDETGEADELGKYLQKEDEQRHKDSILPGQFLDNSSIPNKFRPDSPNSQRTVSSRSFPEVSPEEALMLYRGNHNGFDAVSNEFEDSQRAFDTSGIFHKSGDTPRIFHRTGDDDEIFLITSCIVPSSTDENLSQSFTPAPSSQSSRPTSRGSIYSSRSHTPFSHDGWQSQTGVPDNSSLPSGHLSSRLSRSRPVTPGQEERSGPPQRSVSATPLSNKSRPASVASHRSTASECPSSHPNTARSETSKKLPKAHSEESFFELNKTPRSNEKLPKRLLPKPTAAEESQSFKLKSKSTTNIATKAGPVKPTHMSISEITRLTMEENNEVQGEGEKSQGELTVKLKQEFQKRKQATELVQQLQKDYDSLLSKYALAELTIDQMRLGAKITLHADSPTPNHVQTGTLSALQHVQSLQIGGPNRGIITSSPSPGMAGNFSPLPDSVDLRDSRTAAGTPQLNDSRSAITRTEKGSIGGSRRTSMTDSEDRILVTKNVGAENVKSGLLVQAVGIDERIESFSALLENRQLNVEDQEQVFDKIRADHEKLRRHYLQAKEDYNVLRRSGASLTDANFDQNKELEGELFRLGMKFDEIQEKVDSNLKEKSSKRQPFQSNRLADDNEESQNNSNEQAVDQLKKRLHGTMAGSDLVNPREDSDFDKKLQRLHDEYNALMDRYRRLKQMAKTPERDKEIDNLVRKLKEICDEAPEIFRLPPELEERWEKMQKCEQETRGLNRGKSPLPDSLLGAHTSPSSTLQIERNTLQRSSQQPRQDTPDSGDRSFHQSDLELDSRNRGDNLRQVSNHPQNSRVVDPRGRFSPSLRDRFSPSQRESFSPSPRDRFSPSPRDRFSPSLRDRLSPREGLPGGRDSPRGSDSTDPRLPRPHRRDHDFKDHQMKKHPEGGSMTSLPDSGISDHEQGALANLPGPGKFKQMTRQRGADDVDSGFIGSVVGSDISRLSTSRHQQQQQQQQYQQQQAPIRLHHPGDCGSERGRSSSTLMGSEGAVPSGGVRPSSRNGSMKGRDTKDGVNQTDSMEVTFDDDVTESDLSETETQPKQRKKEGKRGGRETKNERHDRTLDEDSDEEDTDATPRPVQRLKLKNGIKSSNLTSPVKPIHKPRSELSEEEGEITPRATPTRDIPRRKERYFSEDGESETPRSTQTRPTRSEVTVISRQIDANNLRKHNQMEDRGVGSDRDWVVKGSDSDATRGSSVNSSRLRALQEEVEKLKDRVQRTNEMPPPPIPPPNQEQLEYYDPFDDPYGFMRMPRRRANSFSGRLGREWDEWYWTLPNQRQNDGAEIPLGYAAADAYADIPPPAAEGEQESPIRSRIRHRKMERAKRAKTRQKVTTQEHNGYTSDQSPVSGKTKPNNLGEENVGLYDYYVPSRYSTQGMRQQLANKGYFKTPSGAKIYASQLQGSPSAAPHHPLFSRPPPYANNDVNGLPHYHTQNVCSVETVESEPQTRPFYSIRRSGHHPRVYSLPRSSDQPAIHVRQPYSQDDINFQRHYSGSAGAYGTAPSTSRSYVVETDVCQLCGGSGYHTHAEYEETVASSLQPQYSQGFERNRRRSQSVPRLRHYSPENFSHSYLVREFMDDSSAESDDEIYTRRRSRSLSRTRRKTRKYRIKRDSYHSDRRRGYHSDRRDGYYSDRGFRGNNSDECDLNESLHLSEDIGRLTRKMIQTVEGELEGSKQKKHFGSTHW